MSVSKQRLSLDLATARIQWEFPDLEKALLLSDDPRNAKFVSEAFADDRGLVQWQLILRRMCGPNNSGWAFFLIYTGPEIPENEEMRAFCESEYCRGEGSHQLGYSGWLVLKLSKTESSLPPPEVGVFDYVVKDEPDLYPASVSMKIEYKLPPWLKRAPKAKAAATPPNLRLDGPMRFVDARLTIRGHQGPDTPVHKAILAQSPVFARMLESEMEEGQTSRIALDSVVTPEALKGLVDFLYSGQASGLEGSAELLLDLGEQYDLPGLKEQAEEALAEKLSPARVAETYRQAELFSSAPLKAACKRVLLGEEGRRVAGLAELLKEFPDLAVDVALAKLK